MAAIAIKQVFVFLLGWMILIIFLGIAASWIGIIWNLLSGHRVLPERPLVAHRPLPWGSGSVLLVFLVFLGANKVAFDGYMQVSGTTMSKKPKIAAPMPQAQEGAVEKKVVTKSPKGDSPISEENEHPMPDGPAEPRVAHEEPRELSLIEQMGVQSVVNAFLLVLLPRLLRRTSGARLADLGLSLTKWRPQVIVGVVSVLFLMPLLYFANFLAIRALGPFDEQTQHPLEQLLRKEFTPGAAILSFFTAVVLAPLFEEMLFRGILQSWLVNLLNRFWKRVNEAFLNPSLPTVSSPSRVEVHPPGVAIATMDGFIADLESDMFEIEPSHASPSGKGSASDLHQELVAYECPAPLCSGAGIVITSLIFAGLHAAQWPAPIPIFFLAVGLGFIYQRTGSLLATICMHAVFNGFSTLMLFFLLLLGVPMIKEKKVPPPAAEPTTPVKEVKSVVPSHLLRPR